MINCNCGNCDSYLYLDKVDDHVIIKIENDKYPDKHAMIYLDANNIVKLMKELKESLNTLTD